MKVNDKGNDPNGSYYTEMAKSELYKVLRAHAWEFLEKYSDAGDDGERDRLCAEYQLDVVKASQIVTFKDYVLPDEKGKVTGGPLMVYIDDYMEEKKGD